MCKAPQGGGEGKTMLDHQGIYVRDAKTSFRFYRACLAPLGIRMVQARFAGKAEIFMRDGSRFFLFLGEGGSDNGPPGYRDAKTYSAFAYDPDGNNVEAVSRSD